MGASRTSPAVRSHTREQAPITLAPGQEKRIASIAKRQGISPTEVVLRSLDVYEQQNGNPEELVHQMQTVLDRSLVSLREARHALDESNRLVLHYRQHPELLDKEGE